MNLKGKYVMLRAAILNMVGMTDDPNALKAMAEVLQVPAMADDDVRASLTVLQALIVTHDAAQSDTFPEEWAKRAVEWIDDNGVPPDSDAARELIKYIITGVKA